MKKHAFLLFLLFDFLLNQAQPNLDSLWSVWHDETNPDTCRAIAMQNITEKGYLFSLPDSAFYYAQMMYEFAREKGLEKEMAKALSIQGVSFFMRSNFPEALDHYQKSLNICNEISDKGGVANALNNIGAVYASTGNYQKAMYYYEQSLKAKEEISDKIGMAKTLNNIGSIYIEEGDYPKALVYYQRCLKIKEEVSDQAGVAKTLNNIGLIYMNQGDYDHALGNFRECLNTYEEISDNSGMAKTLNNIGMVFMLQRDYVNAMDFFQQSLKMKKEMSDNPGMASTLNNIGEIHIQNGNFSEAMEYFQESLRLKEQMSDKRGIISSLINIGKLHGNQGNHAEAVYWCKKGLGKAIEIDILEGQKNACQCLYDAYKAMGNAAKALEYHESITRLNDSLQIEETSKKLQKMEFARRMIEDSLVQEQEKLRIKMVHDAEVRKKNRTKNIFIVSASFLLIGAIGLYQRVVYIKKAKAAIETEKERSDHLLLNILPAEIAEELKLKGRTEARNFDKVSIIFTDFKDFTSIAEKLSAEELVGEINTCFKSFDEICKKYGIEKIKTIGDSYIAAGGLPVPADDSVRNTVLAGLEMAECMSHLKQKHREENRSPFEMRIGIHSGPVVAGIVGTTKFQYDIWGDTVNTASRIENSGEVGKVNNSQSTYEFIKDDPLFKFYARRKVKTKGKGDLEMWFVEKVT